MFEISPYKLKQNKTVVKLKKIVGEMLTKYISNGVFKKLNPSTKKI